MARLQPEVIGDVEEGEAPDPTAVDEIGLTAEERAAFDGMRDADKDIPQGPEEPEEAPAEEAAPETPEPAESAPAEPAQAKKQPPKEEPEEDDEPDQVTRDPKTGKEQRTISFGKHQRLLKREREQAEAFRSQIEEQKISQAKLAERLAILNDALTAPPQPTPEQIEYQRQQEIAQNPMMEDTIDPSVDLAGAIGQMQRRQIYMAHASQMQQEATQDQLTDQAIARDFTRDAQLFAQTEEGRDFFGDQGAYQFLKNSRLVELGISLFDKDPTDTREQFTQAEIDKMVSDFNIEEKWVVNNALKSGKSPAKAIMRLAKGRGWKPPQAAAAAASSSALSQPAAAAPSSSPLRRTPAVAQAAPPLARPPTAAPSSAVDQIRAEAAGAAASRSLSDGGGVPPAEPLSPERLLKMDDEEFGAFMDNLDPRRLQSIMGREFPGRG